jgi:hypothetical protein
MPRSSSPSALLNPFRLLIIILILILILVVVLVLVLILILLIPLILVICAQRNERVATALEN